MTNADPTQSGSQIPVWLGFLFAAVYLIWPYCGAYFVDYDPAALPVMARLHVPSLIPMGLLFLAWLLQRHQRISRILYVCGWISVVVYLGGLFTSNRELILRTIRSD